MIEKLKDVLLYGFGGMLFSIPFLIVFILIYEYTSVFQLMRIEWEMIAAYSVSCGGALFGIWMTKNRIRSKLFSSTKEEVLKELNK